MKKTEVSVLKPNIGAAALRFAAEADKKPAKAVFQARQGVDRPKQEKRLKSPKNQVSGLVPDGDVRLTANISKQHHIKLKVAAAQQDTTVGELIERLIDESL